MQYHYPNPQGNTILAALVFLLLPTLSFAQETVQGIVRIKVSESLAVRLEQASVSRTRSGEVMTGIESLDQFSRQYQVREFKRVFPNAGKHEARHRRHGLHLWYEVRMNKNIPVTSAIQSYQSEKQILRAEPVYQKAIISAPKGHATRLRIINSEAPRAGTPLPDASNDPLLSSQWHYDNTGQTGGKPGADIKLFEAWKQETGTPNVIVAVTDGGIQTDHPDLAANMWVNPGEIRGNNIDDDNNGYVDDVHGYSFVDNSGNILPHEHGTHIAGTLAAVSNNGIGVAGIAGGSGNGDGIRLMSCAVFSYDSVPDGFAEAYVYSADNGAIISQNSWGYTMPGVFEQVVLDAIDYFIAEAGKNESGEQTGPMNGGLAIFSSGNLNDEGNYYPSYYEPVVAVASTNHKDIRAHYANYGTWVDISAPGGETDVTDAEGVISTLPNSQYGGLMGTSMACPHVSGVAALIVSKYEKPGLRPDAVRARLLQSVDDIYSLNPGYAGKLGSGRLNAALALRDGDNTGPRAVDDLKVENTEAGEITLAWTSPQDEDVVAEYDLRYSRSPITAANFDKAIHVENVPAPKPAGTREQFTVKELSGGVVFYFAIRSADFEGNLSPLSNVISQKSALTPVIAVAPLTIGESLQTAEQSKRSFTIMNKGKGPLKFSLDTGDETRSFVHLEQQEGQLAPGAEQAIALTFDASGRQAGTYRQNITVNNNDPMSKEVVVQLTLNITDNGAPIASLETETLDFKSVQIGQTSFRNAGITNGGSDTLVIRTINSPNNIFQSHTAVPLKVAPFQTAYLRVSFSPAASGPASATLAVSTNDPAHEELLIEMKGQGTKEAPVAASPAFFNETLERGTSATRNLTLTNNGSQPRHYRIRAMNSQLVTVETPAPETGREKNAGISELQFARMQRLSELQKKFSERQSTPSTLVEPFATPGNPAATSRKRTTAAYKREIKKYFTGFEEFNEGPVGEQQGWFAMQGWTIAGENPENGSRHLRAVSQPTGDGETYCLSPPIFDYEEMYYPQYTSASLRMNIDKAKGTTWEVIPQDPWSYVATRIRFNPDGTMDALVIGNDYEAIWKKVPATVPSGYFDLAIEYNNAGSDTSGFPTFYLFVNNQHIFSGTGMASGIGQLALVSPMETAGPMIDVDDLSVVGAEYVPPFPTASPAEGTLQPGESTTVSIAFNASIMKHGNYQSDLVVYLDEVDSLRIPVSLIIPGSASLWRDTYSLYMILEKNQQGHQQVYLKNDGGAPLTFNFQHDIPGLTVNPESGSLHIREEGVVEFVFDGAPGVYQEEIAIHTSAHTQPETMLATIIKYDSGAVFTAPDTVAVSVTSGKVSTSTFRLKNDGINTVGYLAEVSDEISAFVTLDKPKETIGDTVADINITVDATTLDPGTTTGSIRFLTNDRDNRNVYTHIVINVVDDTAEHYIVQEVWSGIRGAAVSSIPVDRPPSHTNELTLFEAPANTGDNYGSRIRGYIEPPVSGSYTFWIASNDNSELWLSTDENEKNKIKIAWVTGYTNPGQWNKYASQRSITINLEANRKYYIEALHKEGVGTDHISVGWQLPDGARERPIPATRLLPFQNNGCVASGTITREYWTGLRGTHVSDIPIDAAPDGTEALTRFEGPANAGTNYGARIRGYICPPESGEYYFWITSNDHSELWLSSDDDPANKERIAYLSRATGPQEWNKFSTQKSAAIFLEEGKTYYVEALHKQGIGTDHISVGWQLPGGTLERPIEGSRLSPFNTEDDPTHDNGFASDGHERAIHAFPNPVTGNRLNVSIQSGPAGASMLRDIIIRDLRGQSVHSQRLDCPEEECDVTVDVSNKLEPGVYLLQVTSGDGNIFTEKLIVR